MSLKWLASPLENFFKMRKQIEKLIYQKEKTIWIKILLFPPYILSIIYGLIIRARNSLYRFNILTSKKLPCPVISIGNITVGGTGKTPLVITLAKELKKREIDVAILSRGYKGRRASGPIVSDGEKFFLLPEESGDEAFLMAKELKNVPVIIGKDRFRNGMLALEQFGVMGIILDDGYQHLRLKRNFDILLIDSYNGFGDHHLLPRGILREPEKNIRRADLIILTKIDSHIPYKHLEERLNMIHPDCMIFHSHYEPIGLIDQRGKIEELDSLKGKKILAFSGIANPYYFFSLLRKSGFEIMNEMVFPDHYIYTVKDLTSIEKEVKKFDYAVTTEKDMVRLSRFNIDHIPIRALKIEVRIWEYEEFYKMVMKIF